MFGSGGVADVYLCYGIHSLLNDVTNRKEIPHVVLIHGIEPKDGIDTLLKRIVKNNIYKGMGERPGKVSRLIGVDYRLSGLSLIHEYKCKISIDQAIIYIEGENYLISKVQL